jgi:AcrR family transcriptional regulator
VSQITMESSASSVTGPLSGRRERHKQRTRDALIHGALALFEGKGYDQTAIREIADAADVSERTFFRYFANKEDLVMSFIKDETQAFTRALAERPPEEDPFTAMRRAYGESLNRFGDTPRVLGLVDSTPALLAAHLRQVHVNGEELVKVLAAREGVSSTDPRPHVLAAVFGGMVFLANREWLLGEQQSVEALEKAFDKYAAQVIPAMAGHWRTLV